MLACNVIGLDHAEAIVRGAEAARAPVILQVSQNAVRYRLGLVEPIMLACTALADGGDGAGGAAPRSRDNPGPLRAGGGGRGELGHVRCQRR